MAGTGYIKVLEQNWLAAESAADEMKHEVERCRVALKSKSDPAAPEVKLILKQSEEAEARHAKAEKAASDAFDRFWTAQGRSGNLDDVRAAG